MRCWNESNDDSELRVCRKPMSHGLVWAIVLAGVGVILLICSLLGVPW
jgi:hypothetical protein